MSAPPAEEPISSAVLKIDDLKIELGYGLLPLVQSEGGSDRLTDQIKALRRQLAADMGFVMPSVRILDNVQLPPNQYIIRVKEVDAGQGQIRPMQYMVMDPAGGHVDLPGVHTTEPTFGLATWVDAALKEEASVRGYTVVDAATVLSTHLTEILKANVSDLLSYSEVQKLIKDLPKEQSDLVKDLVPGQITISGIQRVLQTLLNQCVSIRDDLPTILEGIAEAVAFTRSPAQIAEHVRSRLARQLCAQYAGMDGGLALIALSPQWSRPSPISSSARATTASSPCSPRAVPVHHAGCVTPSTMPPAWARRRCSSPAPESVPSCAPSSSGSGRRPRCSARPYDLRMRLKTVGSI